MKRFVTFNYLFWFGKTQHETIQSMFNLNQLHLRENIHNQICL
jgi:hypothetical protein